MKTIFSKVSVLQNGRSHARLPISFPNTILWLFPNIEQKHVTLNDNIVWCKNSRVVWNLSNSGNFFLLHFPKYLGTILFYYLYAQISHIFWKISFTKKSMKLKRLLRKDKFFQNLLMLSVSVKTCKFQV